MIRRTLQWLGLGHLLTNLESDEIMRAIRHRSAFRTMQLTVMLCFIVSAVIRIWFQELMQVTITLVIVALFMMITNDLINWYRGCRSCRGRITRSRTSDSTSDDAQFLSVFVLIYAATA